MKHVDHHFYLKYSVINAWYKVSPTQLYIVPTLTAIPIVNHRMKALKVCYCSLIGLLLYIKLYNKGF